MKKNILIMFDCFGVVSTKALLPYFSRHFGLEKGQEMIKEYSKLGDMGEMSLMDIAVDLSKITKDDPQDIYNSFIDETVVKEEMKSLLKELKEKYYVVLASNAMEGIVEGVFKKYDLESYFDKVFISYKFKDVKPHKSYFDKIINSFPIKFRKVILIDDTINNIVPLEKYDIIGILFKDVQQAKIELEQIIK